MNFFILLAIVFLNTISCSLLLKEKPEFLATERRSNVYEELKQEGLVYFNYKTIGKDRYNMYFNFNTDNQGQQTMVASVEFFGPQKFRKYYRPAVDIILHPNLAYNDIFIVDFGREYDDYLTRYIFVQKTETGTFRGKMLPYIKWDDITTDFNIMSVSGPPLTDGDIDLHYKNVNTTGNAYIPSRPLPFGVVLAFDTLRNNDIVYFNYMSKKGIRYWMWLDLRLGLEDYMQIIYHKPYIYGTKYESTQAVFDVFYNPKNSSEFIIDLGKQNGEIKRYIYVKQQGNRNNFRGVMTDNIQWAMTTDFNILKTHIVEANQKSSDYNNVQTVGSIIKYSQPPILSDYFGPLIYKNARQFSGVENPQLLFTELVGPNKGMSIDGGRAHAYRIPGLLAIPGYTFAVADMRYGTTADSAHNIDSIMLTSYDSGLAWGSMKYIHNFDDYAPTNVKETRGYNYSSVADSASFIDAAMMYTKNGDLINLVTTFPWNSGLMQANKGRGTVILPSYFKQNNKIYMKLRYGQPINGNSWRNGDNNDANYTYAVEVSSFKSADQRNPILIREGLRPTTGEQAGYSIDQYYNFYKDGIRVTTYQYATGRNDNNKVRVNPFRQINTHLFYHDSLFHPVPTSYVFVSRSKDKGTTWEQSKDITWQFDNIPSQTLSPNKNKNDLSRVSFMGVSPGVGHTVKDGQYQGRLLVALQKTPTDVGSGCSAFSIYSDDNGVTWYSGTTVPANPHGGRRSESQYLEAPDNQLLLVHRTGNYLVYSTSIDGGITWSKITTPRAKNGEYIQNVGSDGFGSMVGIANLRRIHYNSKPMFAVAITTRTGRRGGRLYIGYLDKGQDGFWDMKFNVDPIPYNPNNLNEESAYASVAELEDGSIGLFYERPANNGGVHGGSTIAFSKFLYSDR